jgi:hypothetical protein
LEIINYQYWLSLKTWNYLVTACLLNELHPDELTYTPHLIGGGIYAYHVPNDKQGLLKDLKIMESWRITQDTPTNWIERCLREGMIIPQKLWDFFKTKYLRDCEYDEHFKLNYLAIKKRITSEAREQSIPLPNFISQDTPKTELMPISSVIKTESQSDNSNKTTSYRNNAVAAAVINHILPTMFPDKTNIVLNKNNPWECFTKLKDALKTDGAENVELYRETNKDSSLIAGTDKDGATIDCTYKAFRGRFPNLVAAYKQLI